MILLQLFRIRKISLGKIMLSVGLWYNTSIVYCCTVLVSSAISIVHCQYRHSLLLYHMARLRDRYRTALLATQHIVGMIGSRDFVILTKL